MKFSPKKIISGVIAASIMTMAVASSVQAVTLTTESNPVENQQLIVAINNVTTPLDFSFMRNLTQDFGGWNKSFGGYHTGYDIGTANKNPSVSAIADGTVVLNSTSSSKYPTEFLKYWNAFVIIKHGDFYAYYGHLSSSLSVGNKVSRGSSIGTIRDAYNRSNKKDTGNNHLHISISTNKDWVKGRWGYQSTTKGLNQFVNPAQYIGR